MRQLYIVTILLLLVMESNFSWGQTKNKKRLFLAGNKALSNGSVTLDNTLAGDYSRNIKQDFIAKSIVIWKEILTAEPDNEDANFKLGLSYLYSYDQKAKSLPYLIKSVKKLKKNYAFNNDRGGASPFYALYYLAEAYRMNNQPDSALKYYSVYRNKYKNPPIAIEKEIFMSLNAKNSINNPRNVKVNSLNVINTEYAEANPVLRLDNKRLFFSSRRPAATLPISENKSQGRNSEDIYISDKDASGKWGKPIPFPYNSPFDEVPVFVSADGNTLFIRLTKNKNADIYVTMLKDGVWTKPSPFKTINTGANENGICFTMDGKTVFYSSDESGGTGGYDIYTATQNVKGKWSVPVNLNYPINTSKNEISPNITPDGKTLYFASNGVIDLGIGGYDIYFSNQKRDSTWEVPVNLGYPINKSGDDFGLYNGSEGARVFVQNTIENSFDLFEIEAGDFAPEEVAASVEVVTVTNEMGVTQVVETEKEVEKEVAVVEAIETQVEVEKEVQVTTEVEVEKIVEKEVFVADAGLAPPVAEPEKVEIEPVSSVPIKKEVEAPTKLATSGTSTLEIVNDLANVFYEINKTDISPQVAKDLIPFIEKLKGVSGVTYQVIGHADRKGSWETNLKVSLKRAKKVRDFLVQNGLDAKRVIYYGEGYIKAEADKKENGKDRRVEISILKD